MEEGYQAFYNPETTLTDPKGRKYLLAVGENGNLFTIPHVPHKTLFIGNSLLRGMKFYGMCATAPDKDYYHAVTQAILQRDPEATFAKANASPWERALTDEELEAWWQETAPLITEDLDLISIQFGDNVHEDSETHFRETIDEVFGRIRARAPYTRILVFDCWYQFHRSHPVILAACRRWGVREACLNDLHTKETEAHLGQTYVMEDGTLGEVSERWISHPGDEGFRLISARMLETLDLG